MMNEICSNENMNENMCDENSGIMNKCANPTATDSSADESADVPAAPKGTAAKRIFAILCILLGILYIMWMTPEENLGIGATLFTYLLAGVCCAYAVFFAPKPNRARLIECGIYAALIAVFGTSFFLLETELVKYLAAIFIYALLLYTVYVLFNNREEPSVGDMLLPDLFKSGVCMPLSSLHGIFVSLFAPSAKNGKSSGTLKKIGQAVFGIALAAIPTVFVTILLMSADDGFRSMMENIGDLFDFSYIDITFGDVIGSIAAACVIFGVLYANTEKKCRNVLTAKMCRNNAAAARITPVTVSCAFLIPLLAIYTLFFVSKLGYFLSAFGGNLPADYREAGAFSAYSSYARDGFFELCGVAAINAALYWLLSAFTARMSAEGAPVQKKPLPLRILLIILSSYTMLLIVTALSKMILYIKALGLTPLRLYTTWFMVLLFVMFTLLAVFEIRRFNIRRLAAAVFTVLFAVLVFMDPDAAVAKYNTQRYLAGELETLDVAMFHDLSEVSSRHLLKVAEQYPEARYNGDACMRAEDMIYRNLIRTGNEINLIQSTWRIREIPYYSITLPYLMAGDEIEAFAERSGGS